MCFSEFLQFRGVVELFFHMVSISAEEYFWTEIWPILALSRCFCNLGLAGQVWPMCQRVHYQQCSGGRQSSSTRSQSPGASRPLFPPGLSLRILSNLLYFERRRLSRTGCLRTGTSCRTLRFGVGGMRRLRAILGWCGFPRFLFPLVCRYGSVLRSR